MLLGLVACPLAAVYNAYFALLAYSWLSFMKPQSLAWEETAQTARMTLVVGALLVFRWVLTQRRRINIQGPSLAFLLVWGWFVFTSFVTSTHPDESRAPITDFSKIGIAVLLATGIVQTRVQLKWMMVLLALCPGFWAFKLGQFYIRATFGGESAQSFYGGPMGMDSNDTAMFVTMALPMMYFCACEVAHKWWRRGMIAAAAMAVPAVILTTSRGGLLALLTAMGFTIWRRTGRWKSPLLVGAAILIVFAVAPPETTVRYSTIQTYEKDDSAMGRIWAWKTSVNMAWHNPIAGVGFGQRVYLSEYFRYQAVPQDRPHAAHSVWFSLLGETGFVGVGLYLWMLWQAILWTRQVMRNSIRRHGRRGQWDWAYAAAVQCSIIAFIVGGTFLSQPRFEYVQMLCAITVPLRRIAEAETEAQLPLAAKATSLPARAVAPAGGR